MEAEQAVAYQAGNDNEVLVKELKLRSRIALVVAFSIIAGGFVCLSLNWVSVGVWMFVLGLIPLPYVHRVRRNLQIELAKQGKLPAKESLIPVVISRGVLAALLTALHDPIMISLLVLMAVIALVMAVSGKSAATRARLVKAAIYGAAAIVVYIHVSNDRSQADMLVSKLEEYKRQHGVYPERLDTMIPALLPAIPKSGTQGFKYAIREGYSSYWLTYKPSVAGPCSYTPERGEWTCQAR